MREKEKDQRNSNNGKTAPSLGNPEVKVSYHSSIFQRTQEHRLRKSNSGAGDFGELFQESSMGGALVLETEE